MSEAEPVTVAPAIKPYYEHGGITIYHGDCREILPQLGRFDLLLTDPPYPNNADFFDSSIPAAREVLSAVETEAMVFWNELEFPPVPIPKVAVHIWHRANVNGRPYEPIFHFAPDGRKRRSNVCRTAVPFKDATGSEYSGHPTQKSVSVMRWLVGMTAAKTIIDPFAGSCTTGVAAKLEGREAVLIELDERYCEGGAKRLQQEVLF